MTHGSVRIRPRRCTMFLPGVSPDKFVKAMALDVDGVCVDLEDAVAPGEKDAARERTLPLFADTSPSDRKLAILRINSLRTRDGLNDMLAVLDSETPPPALLLPKVDTASEVLWAEELLLTAKRPVELYALIETNRGLENVFDIARSTPLRLLEGDLVAALTVTAELFQARARTLGVRFETAFPQTPIVLAFDARKLRQALVNLLLNGAEAAAEAQREAEGEGEPTVWLTVSSTTEPRGAEILIRDNGAGFASVPVDVTLDRSSFPDDLVVAGPLKDILGHKAGSSGLGLRIVERLAALHGGVVAILSVPGQGTTVSLRFPKGRMDGSEAIEGRATPA